MVAIRSKPLRRQLDETGLRETSATITSHPALAIGIIALLAAGGALFAAMYPEMKRYLLAKRM
jgi:hypothetical protein